MDETALQTAINGGETEVVEFKRNANKDVAKTLCAFANASGGHIFIGVEDDGRISGIDERLQDEQQQRIYHSRQECNPAPIISIAVVNLDGKTQTPEPCPAS